MQKNAKKYKHTFLPSGITSQQILDKTMEKIAPLPSQQGYAEALASIFSMHVHKNELLDDGFSADDLPTNSALVVAPTGQGKTYLFRKMAETLGLNTIVIDCSTLAAEGWKGNSLSQHLSANLHEVGNMDLFKRSVILLDEVDKLKFWGTQNDQGNAAVNILQMFNNGSIALTVGKDTENVDVSRFTVLFGGAFDGLDNIIRERLCPKPKIGFSTEEHATPQSTAELLQQATLEDLANFGLIRELLGRIGTILTIPKLELEDFRQLLSAPTGSICSRYATYLDNLYGVGFEMTPAAVDWLAKSCMSAQTGARAATPLVDAHMRKAMAGVEANPEVNRVVLDANDTGCYIRYETGCRTYAYRSPERAQRAQQLPWHTVKGTSYQALVHKLVRYYQRGGGQEAGIPQLESFLLCSFHYLMNKVRPEERTFQALEQFARATNREGRAKSSFDVLMSDNHYLLSDEYHAFDKAYVPDTQQKLATALRTIMEFLQSKHGDCRVRFEVFDPKSPVPEIT